MPDSIEAAHMDEVSSNAIEKSVPLFADKSVVMLLLSKRVTEVNLSQHTGGHSLTSQI